MTRDTTSTSKSDPTTKHGRQIVYDREIFIGICRRRLAGEDLRAICSKPPMPIAPVFLGWVQDHQEAREIYRSMHNFGSDQGLAKELGVAAPFTASEWEEQVRANIRHDWPADYIQRKYIPPDWTKVYPLVGGPPVWSTENMQAYNHLLNAFTQMLEPRDEMELIWTKEAADATWELARHGREKNGLPERKYQQRLKVEEEYQRRTRAAEPTVAKPATVLDHSRGLEAGFKHYQAHDVAQTRLIKRRDNALRQIERWRAGLGAKARALSDKFVAEEAVAERYGAAHLLEVAETDVTAGDAVAPLAPAGEAAAQTAPPVPLLDAVASPPIAAAGETPQPVPPLASASEGPSKEPP
jgi:hypothetical protein